MAVPLVQQSLISPHKQVLSLDSNVTEKVADLKLDLLRILNVGQFSEQAEFHDPSTTFILSEVVNVLLYSRL